jgi:hypothetical protein
MFEVMRPGERISIIPPPPDFHIKKKRSGSREV